MTESEISKSIAQYLSGAGIFNLRLQSGRVQKGKSFIHLCKNGTPDRMALVKGKSIFIEVKTKDGKFEPEQQNVHHEIERSGGKVIVARSFDDFLTQFTAACDKAL